MVLGMFAFKRPVLLKTIVDHVQGLAHLATIDQPGLAHVPDLVKESDGQLFLLVTRRNGLIKNKLIQPGRNIRYPHGVERTV